MVFRPTPNGSSGQRTNHMMNIDNSGIENTQSDDTSAIEATEIQQTPVDAEYEAAFAAELAAEEGEPTGEELEDSQHPDLEDVEAALDGATDAVADLEAQSEEPSETEGDGEGKPKTPPAYIAFIAAVEAHAKALGLGVKEQKSFFQFWAASGHKLYVEKALKKNVGRVDTSLPRSALVVNGKDISLPLSKPNGRIACHVDPSVESVKQALEVLAAYSDKIPAPKKPAAKDQAAA